MSNLESLKFANCKSVINQSISSGFCFGMSQHCGKGKKMLINTIFSIFQQYFQSLSLKGHGPFTKR